MEANKAVSPQLTSFVDSGVYSLDEGLNFVFLDPLRIHNVSYTRFTLSPSACYSRTFKSNGIDSSSNSNKKKRQRRKKALRKLNEREIAAEKRHQEVRPLLVTAHKSLLRAKDLLEFIPSNVLQCEGDSIYNKNEDEIDFIELGQHSHLSLHQISLCFRSMEGKGSSLPDNDKRMLSVFNNLISNLSNEDIEVEFFSRRYIMPARSCFYMSDLRKVRDLVPDQSDLGYNFIVIDPPWENGSVYQKAMYPTLPNRHLLYIPIKELAHTEGALVALWMTNREKLRNFVEKELFPAWGVTQVTVLYWLKVKPDGSLIGELDLFHHRPYECLLVGYVNSNNADHGNIPTFARTPTIQVFMSIPGAYSRKPPLGKLLQDCIPGPQPPRCLELFARELTSGWTSWGNEPLHFQDTNYFIKQSTMAPN